MNEEFHSLYSNLATAWESHQTLRRSNVEIAVLANSAWELDLARQAMYEWHRSYA